MANTLPLKNLKRTAEANCSTGKQSKSAKLDEPDYSDAVIIVVGRPGSSKFFSVPKSILCSKSAFFAAACFDTCKDAVVDKIQLPTQSPALFQAYLHWIFTGSVNFGLLRATAGPLACLRVASEDLYTALVDLYCLATYVKDEALCTLVLKRMVDVMEYKGDDMEQGYPSLPSSTVLRKAYNMTNEDSPMRSLLVSVYTGRAARNDVRQVITSFLQELVQELALMSIKEKTVSAWSSIRAKIV